MEAPFLVIAIQIKYHKNRWSNNMAEISIWVTESNESQNLVQQLLCESYYPVISDPSVVHT